MWSIAKHTFYSVRLVEVHNTMHIYRRHCITSFGLVLQKTNNYSQQHGFRSDFLAEITNLSMHNLKHEKYFQHTIMIVRVLSVSRLFWQLDILSRSKL